MPGHVNILLALQTDTAFDRRALTGVAAQANTDGNTLLHLRARTLSFAQEVKNHDIHGIIISSDYLPVVEEAAATGKPCVNIANLPSAHDLVPLVGTDDVAIGTMIADHFLSRGFKHFASYCDPVVAYFAPRHKAFCAAIQAAGFDCHVGPTEARNERHPNEKKWDELAGAWLRSLPKPLAVMTPYDGYAREAVIVCKAAGLRVPEEVSIIGVDNDEMLCMTVWPQLSSVATHGERIGYQAMELLRKMVLTGASPPAKPILIKPSEIIIRGSSSDTATEDLEVAAAVRFIRTNASRPIHVSDVVDHVAISRRTLERRFAHALNRNIADEIRRAHVELAKKLLTETDISLPEVARRSGLIRQQHLCRVLKQETGLTPRKLREEFRMA